MKKIIPFLLCLPWYFGQAQPQNPLLYSFSSAGGATGTGSPPSYFASIGQPMVYARPTAFKNGGGVMNVTNYLFSSGSGDGTPPTISFTQTPTVLQGAQTVIDVNMNDNVSVALGRIYYRPITGGPFTQLDLTSKGSGVFEGIIPSTVPDNMGLEFYFEAFDASNKTTSPSSAPTGTYYAYFTFNPATMPVFANTGNEAKNYRIMAMPLNMNNRNPSFVYGELSEISQKTIRVWAYDPALSGESQWLEYPKDFLTMDEGKGYFVILAENKNFDLGQQKAPSYNRLNLFTETLKPGWNLIGNPYTVPINWDDVKTFNGNPSNLGTLKEFVSGAYVSSTTLDAFKGAFVYLNGSSSLPITIPFVGQTTLGGRVQQGVYGTDISKPIWKMNMNVRQGNNVSTISGFGMHPEASISYDQYDDFNPPTFTDYTEIGFSHPEHSLGAFAFDVAPSASKYVWRFTSKGNTSNHGELFWDNSELGDNNIELYLYDEDRNTVVNMRTENKYSFSPLTSHDFKIYYGKDISKNIAPDNVKVFAPYPNPFTTRSEAKFDIGLPESNSLSSHSVELQIHNSLGLPVFQNGMSGLAPGIYSLKWNGKRYDETDLSPGLYIYTVKVNGQTFSGKLILE